MNKQQKIASLTVALILVSIFAIINGYYVNKYESLLEVSDVQLSQATAEIERLNNKVTELNDRLFQSVKYETLLELDKQFKKQIEHRLSEMENKLDEIRPLKEGEK